MSSAGWNILLERLQRRRLIRSDIRFTREWSQAVQPIRSALDVLTFTPRMAYRASGVAAPLAVAVPVQGQASRLAGDTLTYGRGTQVVGLNYDTANPYQGSVAVLFEIPVPGNDGAAHTIWRGGGVTLVKTAANQLQVTLPDGTSTITTTGATVAGWARGSRHLAVVQWDADTIVTGSSYSQLVLDGTATVGGTSPLTVVAPSATAYLGSDAGGANALGGIGLIYAVESSYLWSATELTALYNGGSFASPDRTLLRQDATKVYYQPGLRAASGSFTGTLTAEACGANHRAYNVTTNAGGDLLATNGMFETDAALATWTASNAILKRIGRARSFNGSTQYMVNSSTGFSPGTSDFSLSAMVYPTVDGFGLLLWGGGTGPGASGYALQRNANGTVTFNLNDGDASATAITSVGTIPINTWSHVLVAINRAGTGQIYLNTIASGAAVDVTSKASAISLTNMYVAATSYAGRIARVKYWSRLATAGEITADYNGGKGLYYAECAATAGMQTNLDHAFDLEEESGNAVAEVGGITLTAVGSPLAAAGPDIADMVGLNDLSAQKVIATTAGAGDSIYNITGLTAGWEIFLTGLTKKGTAGTGARLRVWSGTAGSPEATLVLDVSETAGTVTPQSASVTVGAGHDQLRVKVTANTATAGTTAIADNIRAWRNLVTNGSMEGTFVKTGSALHTSTAATTTYSATRATDGTAWTLTNAVVGMIAEASSGKYGFITAIGSNYVDVDAWVGGTPANGEACAVYSALAPGWSRQGTPRTYRTTGRSGTYAQGVVAGDSSNYIYREPTVTSGQWYLAAVQCKRESGTGGFTFRTYSPDATSGLQGTGGWDQTSLIVRATSGGVRVGVYGTSTNSIAVDDVALLPLLPHDLTATPASEANSQDAVGFREDGGDTNTLPTATTYGTAGCVAMKRSPVNWNGNDGRQHTLFDTTAVSNCRIRCYKSTANTLIFSIFDAAGAEKTVAGDVSALITAGTAFTVGCRWAADGTMGLKIGTTNLTTAGGVGTGILASSPTPTFWGSDNASANQADCQHVATLIGQADPGDAGLANLMASIA